MTATSRPGPPNTSRGGTTPAREAATPPPRAISARILPEPSSPTPRRATRCVIAAACRRRRAGFLRGERPRVGHRQRGRGCRGPKASGRGLPQAGPRHAGCHQLRAERGCVASDAISPGALHGPRKEMSRRLVLCDGSRDSTDASERYLAVLMLWESRVALAKRRDPWQSQRQKVEVVRRNCPSFFCLLMISV